MKNRIISLFLIFASVSMLFCACKNETPKVASSSSSTVSSSSTAASSSQNESSSTSSKTFPDPEKDPQYVKAYQAYAAKKYETAENICDEAIKKDDKTFWAYNIKGISVYFANGNSVAQKCIALINKSIEINPDYSYAYFNRALIEKGTKKWDNSISDFEKVLSYNNNDTWSYYGIATVYADTDDSDNAIKYLKLAMNLDEKGVKEQIQDDMSRHYSRLKNDSRFKELIK